MVLKPGFFLRRFRDPNRVPKIRENRVPRIREIGSLQIHTAYLTFSLKKQNCLSCTGISLNIC